MVTYQKQDGTLSSPSTSTTFTPIVQNLDFPGSVLTTTPAPNYGCATSMVSYNLIETPCTSGPLCNYIDNVLGSYNITWQGPVGWVQTSLTNKGSNVSFIPDATSTGYITATIHISGCSYTETRAFDITRGAEAPTFFSSTMQACSGSSAAVSINPVCGASTYTYTIIGNPGVTFTSNGLQTITSSSTSINLSASGGSSTNSITAKTNFANGISSAVTNATFNVYSAKPSFPNISYVDNRGDHPIQYWPGNYNNVCNSYNAEVQVTLQDATSATWTKVTSNPLDITWVPNVTGNGYLDFYFWEVNQTAVFEISASNACGTTTNTFGFNSIDCSGGGGGCSEFIISPNPAQGTLNVIVPDIPAPCGESMTSNSTATNSTITKYSITQVRIYDKMGSLMKVKNENNSSHSTVDLTGINPGVYFVEIIDGSYTEMQQVIIQ